jgi:hypothetical protein
MMAVQLEHHCDHHPDPFDCADQVVYRTDSGDFGLIIHDGGSSYIAIEFCPWCGSALGSVDEGKERVP